MRHIWRIYAIPKVKHKRIRCIQQYIISYFLGRILTCHYDNVIMDWIASQITSLPVVCSIVYSGVNQRKHQSSASLAFVWEIHRGPVNFPHKWPVTRKMFPFDDVIMFYGGPWMEAPVQNTTRITYNIELTSITSHRVFSGNQAHN